MKLDVAKSAVVAVGFLGGLRVAAEVAACFRGAHAVQNLRGGGGRRAHDMQFAAAPVGRHLAAAAGRISGRAHGLQKHLFGRHAQRQAERAVPVVGQEPVVACAQRQPCAHLKRLVACTRNLEEDLLLPLE